MITVQVMDRKTDFVADVIEIETLQGFAAYFSKQCDTRSFYWRVKPSALDLTLPRGWHASRWEVNGVTSEYRYDFNGEACEWRVYRTGDHHWVACNSRGMFAVGPRGRTRNFKTALACATFIRREIAAGRGPKDKSGRS